MANRMAGAMANRMAKLMANLWQNDAPNPNPNPNTQSSRLAVVFNSNSDQIQSHRYLPALAAPIGFGEKR